MDGSRGWTVVLRRRRRPTLFAVLAVVGALAAALVGCALVGAGPGGARADAAAAPRTERAVAYRLGDPSTATTLLHYRGRLRGRTVADSSAARHDGHATGVDRRIVSLPAGKDERFLRFPGRACLRDRDCPRALIVPSGELEPGENGRGAFSFGAWVRLTQPPGSSGMTVIQSGGHVRGGRQWSLRVDDNRVSCRWSDGNGTAVLPDDLGRSAALDLRRWYALSCARRGEHLTLTVTDAMTSLPVATFTTSAPSLGSLAAEGPVTIGATPRDRSAVRVVGQFRGDLDEVMFRAG